MSADERSYRCTVCGELVALDNVDEHTDMEKTKPGWLGFLVWERVEEE